MSSRTNILNRIRTALQRPADRPPHPPAGSIFKPIPSENLIPYFQNEVLKLKAEFHLASDWKDAQEWVRSVAEQNHFSRVVASHQADVLEASQLIKNSLLSDETHHGKKLADVDLGITPCDYLIARTGSVMLTSQSGNGRALSVLPPAHMVVARTPQLLPDLKDAYHLMLNRYRRHWPSMMTFITGPSRTSDIEKTLVLGAHGPKKLFILLLNF